LWERSVRSTHHFLDDREVLRLRPLVAAALETDAVDWWVLISAEEATIGFLGYTRNTIEALFIDPVHQRRGGGTFLVAHAQSLSGSTLVVDVNEQNNAALRFYENLGFSVTGRSPLDAGGQPFPILHMRRALPRSSGAA
jgi:putative acetyltransferase